MDGYLFYCKNIFLFIQLNFRETIYETPYSLLDNLSPAYREAFGNDLTNQLLKLKKQREEESSSD